MRNRVARVLAALVLAATATMGLAACTAPEPITADELEQALDELPGVVDTSLLGELHMLVTVGERADDDEVLETAAVAAQLAREGSWPGEVVLEREPAVASDDMSARAPWSQRVYPGDPAEVSAVLAELLTIEAHPDVEGVAVLDGWPYVTLASLDGFVAAFDDLRILPRFADGATFTFGDHLKIVFIPERVSPEAVAAIVRVAQQNPEAEVELASVTSGPRWPQLYVSHLDEAQVAVVDAQLRDPALADADPEGYSLPFQLSFVGPDGPVYTFGTFGDVPDTSS